MDGPITVTGVHRHSVNFKHLSLTPFVVKIGRGSRAPALKAALKKADVLNKFAATGPAKKFKNQTLRANLTDFDRFKVMLLKKKVSLSGYPHILELR